MTGGLVCMFAGEIPCVPGVNTEYLLNSLPNIESSIPALHGISAFGRFTVLQYHCRTSVL